PSKLGKITDEIRETASRLAPGADTITRARAFYDHVLGAMTYDKSGTGWGRGDTVYACDVGRGNCTDFHSYFIAMCQSQDIPARFQIGLYGAYDRKSEEYQTGGYHCWAEFYAQGHGWIPVDISEADKDPTKVDYFFGAHSPNRVTLSTGRDVDLAPRQQGEPLNFFLNPYAEVGGVPHATTKVAYWRDE
ncbi:MAG: transglutaminase domain-containing protein, partial [Planctomycetes bacterium]|nr:transglutaminase domain-containing protein [Planctomycetota bacterium]